ncbi:MAG: beta-glucoside-specific PTS transporter subunit IIABC [Corynebacterium sp.]|nr:beta-glucoside-specific PTS transporter subunit IIABC [Corynebacterium sp.]
MVSKVDYGQLATDILHHIGGADNVQSVVHCATRLRFVLNDHKKVDVAALRALPGVITTVESGGQFQVVIGNSVSRVYQQLPADLGNATGATTPVKQSLVGKAIDIISAIFAPLLGVLAAAGILKGFLALFVALGWVNTTATTYAILYSTSDALFFFLPVLLAATAARKFGANMYTSITIAAALLYTEVQNATVLYDGVETQMPLLSYAQLGESVTFLGIPVVMQSYGSTVIPIIVAVWVQSLIEKRCDAWLHESVRTFFTPLFALMIIVPLTLITLGPAGVYIGEALATVLQISYDATPVIASALIAMLWQVMVIFGVHWGIVPVFMNNFTVHGFDPLMAACFPAVLSQAGAAFGLFLRLRNAQDKALAGSATLAGIFGVTEPAVYGVTLPRKRPFILGIVAAGCGGIIVGLGRAMVYGAGTPALLTLTLAIDPTGSWTNFYWLSAGTLLAFILAATFTYFFGLSKQQREADRTASQQSIAAPSETPPRAGVDIAVAEKLVAPADGTVVALADVNDPVFSSLSMGNGIALLPDSGTIYAPISGTVKVAMKTGHAYGIRTANGIDVLIHIGLDTVALKGAGFTPLVTKGDEITAGQPIAEVDLPFLTAEGLDPTTIVVIPEPRSIEVTALHTGKIRHGQPLALMDTPTATIFES